MKKIVVITTILIGFQIYAKSQHWDLFPKNQYSMFELSFNNQPSFIERIVNDSTIVFSKTTISYFNTKWISCAKCSNRIDNKSLKIGNSYLQLDSCFYVDNWSYFLYLDKGGRIVGFKFNGHAKVNDSWAISENTTIKCDSVSQRLIFGQLDSVKYFSNTKVNIPFVLSKTYGLLEFTPFYQLLYANAYDIGKVKLIGLENNGNKIGANIPEFKDFFHLKTGDIVFWNYHYDSWYYNEQPINYYYRDSITKSIITDDSVIYEINSIRDSNITKNKQSYYKDKITNFLKANTSLGFFSNNNPCGFHLGNRMLKWQCTNIVCDSNFFSLSFSWFSLVLDTTDCKTSTVYDAGSSFSLDTRVGLSSCNGSIAVGAIINGEKWGMTNIPAGISESVISLDRIYPNPCNNKLSIQLSNSDNLHYKLFDINGQLIKGGQINTGYIDLSDVQNGFYNLQIYNDKIQMTRKIIKINDR